MGKAEASPIVLVERTGLVALALVNDTCACDARSGNRGCPVRSIDLNSQVTFGQFLRTEIADEGESVAELELSDGDNVALESNLSLDVLGDIAAGQSEY